MKSREKLWEICKKIYRELYLAADPQADFDNLVETGEAKKPDWFMNYYLDQGFQDKIMDEILNQHSLTKWEKQAIRTEVILGCSPRGVK